MQEPISEIHCEPSELGFVCLLDCDVKRLIDVDLSHHLAIGIRKPRRREDSLLSRVGEWLNIVPGGE